MNTFYNKFLRPGLIAFCAIYITLVSIFLIAWAPYGFEGATLYGFVVSLAFVTVSMWAYTAYEVWKAKTGSRLTFSRLVDHIIEAVPFRARLVIESGALMVVGLLATANWFAQRPTIMDKICGGLLVAVAAITSFIVFNMMKQIGLAEARHPTVYES